MLAASLIDDAPRSRHDSKEEEPLGVLKRPDSSPEQSPNAGPEPLMNAIIRNLEHQPLHIRVLGYKEDGEWVALALEMDLRGFGATFGEALVELRGLIEAQVASAIEEGHPEAILFPAEQNWFKKWGQVFRSLILGSANNTRKAEDYSLADLPFPFWNRESASSALVSA